MISFHNYSERTVLAINKDLTNQNEKIKAQDEEKSVLVKEVHHRVKNNLQIISSLLRMQSNEINNEEAKVHFEEAVNRVMSMALIHQKLYQGKSLSDIKLNEYFEELSVDLQEVYKNEKNIHFNFDIQIDKIGLKSIVPLGLLYNELVSNSLKHAFENKEQGEIKINITKNDEGYSFIYSDNGQWKGNVENGFGTELVETLTEQLDGSYNLNKTEDRTVYDFKFQNLNE